MPHLAIATTATSNPMGAEAYQAAIRSRAQTALDAAGAGWSVSDIVARSLRSPLPGNRRLPMGWLFNASPRQRRALGRLVYPPDALVHRMDLLLPPSAGPDVVTLHDMVAWDFEDEAAPVRAAADELRAADAVICVSDFTARTAQERLGLTNTVVVPNGVSSEYFSALPLDPEVMLRMSLRQPYVLYAGGSARRKNLPALAEAWRRIAAVRPDWQLALSGAVTAARQELFEGIPRVVHLGRVPDEQMPSLMAGAGVAVVPSLYEGFGLPALEAMAAGVPLVAGNTSSLPEVVGDGGTLVDPTPDGLSQGLEFVTAGGRQVDSIRTAGLTRAREFTWERSAAGHVAVWTKLGAGARWG